MFKSINRTIRPISKLLFRNSKSLSLFPSFSTTITYGNPLAKIQHPAPKFDSSAVLKGEITNVNLEQYKGKYVVLLFYPKDFTFVCPTEIIAFNDRHSEFEAINTQVIALSCDSAESHFAWVNTPRNKGGLGDIQIPIVSDLTKEIANQYGVLLPDIGIALRGLFIINPKGVLEQMTVNNLPVGRSVDETIRLIQAIQFNEKYGEVCPANWKPGDATIDVGHASKYFGAGHTQSETEKKVVKSHKKVIELQSSEELKELLETKEKVVVDFYKIGCQKCQLMAPHFADLSETLPNVTFAEIEYTTPGVNDVLKVPIEALPEFRCFKKGKQVYESIIGYKKKPLTEQLTNFSNDKFE